jgi:hypothetical protein
MAAHLLAVTASGSGSVEVGSSTTHCCTSYVKSSLPTASEGMRHERVIDFSVA